MKQLGVLVFGDFLRNWPTALGPRVAPHACGQLLPFGLGHYDGATMRRVISRYGVWRPVQLAKVPVEDLSGALDALHGARPDAFVHANGAPLTPMPAYLRSVLDAIAKTEHLDAVALASHAYNLDRVLGMHEYGVMLPHSTAQRVLRKKLRDSAATHAYLSACGQASLDDLEYDILHPDHNGF